MALYHEILATWIRRKWELEGKWKREKEKDDVSDRQDNNLMIIANGQSAAGNFKKEVSHGQEERDKD